MKRKAEEKRIEKIRERVQIEEWEKIRESFVKRRQTGE